MEYLIGVLIGVATVGLASVIGLDRGRVFYSTIAIVNATYYVLFAVMGAPGRVLAMEIAVATVFSLLAIVGFKKNLWLVAAALAGHGLFDLVHHLFIDNPGMPQWWPGFCLTFDAVAGAWLAARIMKRSLKPSDQIAHPLRRSPDELS